MVAFASDYTPAQTRLPEKNRAGDFFLPVPDRAGRSGPQTRTVAGENEWSATIERRGPSLEQGTQVTKNVNGVVLTGTASEVAEAERLLGEIGSTTAGKQRLDLISSVYSKTGNTVSLALVSGDGGVKIGSWASSTVDMADILALPTSGGMTQAGAFTHELVEQSQKQLFGEKVFLDAHRMANITEGRVTGYMKLGDGVRINNPNGSMSLQTNFSGPNGHVTTYIDFQNGNVTGVR